ncbi:tRNA lysidine(34) synthetase TilS [Halomonas eurihalina]|uniref:tRNA(Ile)-lysidine synthase n=1 Tax=Halomonas eurihalina TaxID=42566 RepID=A0A5D9D753_HALER|nr:tRNA lysidine(34) synthetase TilS [Halomonas eurihalina]MDR5859017.1 tRNA lysidine(34) synthetase TilS [Halomonas eurihalina]TZG39517.1 tRNA lysidine(34) synthetase TilS [Halomonas eurihalina]
MSLESSSLQTLLDEALAATPPGRAVWVALSGGLDSSLLLTLAVEASRRHPRPLRALHVHHGLQAAADDFERHCHELCERLGAPLWVERVDVDVSGGEGLEGAARRARYAAFQRCLEAGDTLWLAQHRDDQAETFLLAALRGAGPRGVAAMPIERQQAGFRLVRPWLGVSRAALEAEAARRGLGWAEDPSNAEMIQDRNFLRHRVMPALRERWPEAGAALARSAELAGEADGLLDEFAAEDLERLGGDPGRLAIEHLMMLSTARRRLLIRHCSSRLGLSLPPARRLDSLLDQLEARRDAEVRIVWKGAEARVWRKALYLMAPPVPLPLAWRAEWDGRSPLVTPLGEFHMNLVREGGSPASLMLAPRLGGERLRLSGRGRRDLKRLLQELDVPPWQRDRAWVAWHGESVVALGGPEGWLALAEGWRAP